jgi:sugar-specific transcriptional regulator TrmB
MEFLHKNIPADILSKFGLNRNDIIIYTALYGIGRSKTGPIIKETNIVSSRVYESLRILVQKGLVSYQVKNNIKYYQAELPHEIIAEAEKHTLELRRLSQELELFPISHVSRNETNTYEGVRGFKMAYEQHTDSFEPGEEVCIMAFVGKEYMNSRSTRAFFSETVDRIMIEKKCTGRMITHKGIEQNIKKERPDSSIYTIRHLPEKYRLPYTLNISKKEVMMSVWGENPVVFTIKNPVVVEAFQKNFESMWNIAKK